MNDFLHREWWERLWVWKESQLANSRAVVVCGPDGMPWQTLRKAIVSLLTKQSLPLPSLRKRLHFIEAMTLERLRCSINLLLSISRARKCSDPRDKIYGMLSIAGGMLGRSIFPDYATERNTASVYHDVFRAYTESNTRLDLLASCELAGTTIVHLPSWVSDLPIEKQTAPRYAFQLAGAISSCDAIFVGNGILRATGKIAAVI